MSKPLPAVVRTHFTALRVLLVLTVILGIAYPLLVTGISQVAFSGKANGSIVKSDGKEVGSSLLGQNYDLPKKNPDDPKEDPVPPTWARTARTCSRPSTTAAPPSPPSTASTRRASRPTR